MDWIHLAAFLPAALALNLTPGADMLFCLAAGARGGARQAALAAAGISTGVLIHAALAGLGLGAVIARAPWAFDAIRWAGCGYLLWLAWRTLRRPLAAHGTGQGTGHGGGRPFRDGLVVNLSNPKVILFILALLPQFADPAWPVLPQFLIFGAVLAAGGFAVNATVGAASGRVAGTLARRPGVERGLRIGTAGVFGALALKLALERR